MLKKIVIIGPESTGKSTLSRQLAAHYNTRWCPEYAREFLLKNGTDYSFDDLLVIAKGQLSLEEEYIKSLINGSWPLENTKQLGQTGPLKHTNKIVTDDTTPAFTNDQRSTANYLFIDTDQYVMKVWCEYVFNQCHTWILNRIVERPCDLYLLCNIDLPWVKDELREYPDELPRQHLYHMYKDLLTHQQVPWVDISGDYNERLKKAKQDIDHRFGYNNKTLY
ncbi:MAG TPA: ATP-binding protein [Ferruginibacter sp.]|nr:ATP-binding protein [Ferruginibacter sp.]